MQLAARVNEAYRTLGEPVARARYLLSLKGVEALDETDTSLPVEFLERQLERRERASDAAEAGDAEALEALLREVSDEAASTGAKLGPLLDAPAPAREARDRIRELAFLDKLARDVDAMLAEA